MKQEKVWMLPITSTWTLQIGPVSMGGSWLIPLKRTREVESWKRRQITIDSSALGLWSDETNETFINGFNSSYVHSNKSNLSHKEDAKEAKYVGLVFVPQKNSGTRDPSETNCPKASNFRAVISRGRWTRWIPHSTFSFFFKQEDYMAERDWEKECELKRR